MRSGNSKCVLRLLKEPGVDINQQDALGWTPLHYASKSGEKEIVTLLIMYHCNVDIKNFKGKTPLQLAKNKDVSIIIKKLGTHKSSSVREENTESFRETINRSRPRPESLLLAQQKEEEEVQQDVKPFKRSNGIIIAKVGIQIPQKQSYNTNREGRTT